MSIKVRFAPSPTGYLHVGNIRTALVNWLFAKKNGGHFLLRIDDTDTERSKDEYTAAIKEDMQWLGLTWDSEEHQSTRFDRYSAAAANLRAQDRLYACYESPEELDIQRKMLASRGLPPIYNRSALKLTDQQKSDYEAQGRKPHYRFLLNDEEIVWDDLIRGKVAMRASTMSDPVLLREDGGPVYTLASVVDDGELNITHVIRGEDHVSNTAVQVQLYKALGFPVPEFAHMALLKTKDGEMSKRLGGNDIRALRDAGILPMAINSLLARIGTSDAVEPFLQLATLAEGFDFKKFGRAPANYDVAELEKLNEKILHQLPFDAVRGTLSFINEPFWLAVRTSIKTLAETKDWWSIVHGDIPTPVWDSMSRGITIPAIEAIQKYGAIGEDFVEFDKEYLNAALALLPTSDWDETTWSKWTKAIATSTGRKGKELFQPLRFALTAKKHGPEMKLLLPLMGYDKVASRLKACVL